MKKIIVKTGLALLSLLLLALAAAYLTIYPRHYDADEFDNLEAIAYAAENLRVAGLRGRVARDYLPSAIWDLDPEEVRVYPSGVLIRMRGFFSFESGLYVPSDRVAEKIDARQDPIYRKLENGVYSYKVEG